jgi:hypothetical protein
MPKSTVPIRPSIVLSLCATVSLGTLAMTGPTSAYTTGAEMIKACQPFIDYMVRRREGAVDGGDVDGLPCMSYIVGAVEAVQTYDHRTSVCVPEKTPTYMVGVTVLDFARKSPAWNAVHVIIGALRQAYPCRPGEHKPTTPGR